MEKDDKKIEDRMRAYYNDLQIIKTLEEKLKFLNLSSENKDNILNSLSKEISEEIKETKGKIFKIKFKNKHIELFLDKLTEEEKAYLELRYKEKLKANEIMSRLYMVERTYYKMRRKIINKLKDLLI